MKNIFIKQTLVLSLFALALIANAQDATLLKYGFKKGKTYLDNMQLSNIVTQSMGGQEFKNEVIVKSTSEWLVENVDNAENATILVSLKKTKSVTKFSATEKDSVVNNDLNEQAREVYSSAGNKISSSIISISEAGQFLGSLSHFTKILRLPVRPIKFGEKWTENVIDSIKATEYSPSNLVFNSVIEFTLAGKEIINGVELYKITYSVTLQVNGSGNQMGMEAIFEGNGKSVGVAYFNPKLLLVVSNNANMELDMNLAISGQENAPMNQRMQIATTFVEM